MRFASSALLLALAIPAVSAAQPGDRRVVVMDSARAAQLYVSNRLEDHPPANYAQAVANKARTDSIYTARSAGRMSFKKISYTSTIDGLTIPAYLFEPLQPRGPRAHAALVWVHGGVHGDWTANYLPFVLEAIDRGYVVIAPEYRGSTGYGEDFHRAIDYGGKEVDDVLSSVDVLTGLPHVDPTRIGVMGWSHGGFIAAHLLFRGATPFAAGAAIVPVTNLVFRLSYKGPSYQRAFSTHIGGLPFEQRAEYIKRSPVFHVDGLRVPLLVHAATNDTDVDWVEAQQMIDALRARKPALAETKVYVDPTPGPTSGGHTFSRRVNTQTWERDDSPEQVDSWNLVWDFFARHLRVPAGR
jgi:dipeptidyl aminopeptidase/acylaminoacyl peptidase